MKFFLIMAGFLSLFFSTTASTDTPDYGSVIREYFGAHPKKGEGTVYKFIVPAYDIRLWCKAPQWSFNTLFALQVKVKWNADQAEMVDSTLEAMERTARKDDHPLTETEQKEYSKLLYSFYPALKDGDTVTVVYIPGEKIRFYHNDKWLKDITDDQFARAFCNIWLSPNTKFTSAREGLLGSAC